MNNTNIFNLLKQINLYRIIIGIAIVISVINTAMALEDPVMPENFPDIQILGRIEGNSTHFEINNSQYLNITLDSSEAIRLTLESVPEMVTMYVGPISDANSTQMTISGFNPETTYHKYEDDYHNHLNFTTDINGNYTYIQDLSNEHIIFIQPRSSTKFIKDNATGGDCTLIGMWIAASRTCTLTTDSTETIQIDSNGITLDGGGHTITGSDTGSGVYLAARNNITIKNLNVKMFVNGISIFGSINNMVVANKLLDNWNVGIMLDNSYMITMRNNEIYNNEIWGGNSGIKIEDSNNNILSENNINKRAEGITMYDSSDNTVTGNSISNSSSGIGIYYHSINNTLIGNRVTNNLEYGISLSNSGNNTLIGNLMSGNRYNFADFDFDQNIDTSNMVDGKPIYYLKNIANQIYDSSTNMGILYCINCNNITIKELAFTKNFIGIYLKKTRNSRIENILASETGFGIVLENSSDNMLSNNNISNNFGGFGGYGIYLAISNNNILNYNNVSNNGGGIYIYYSENNELNRNNIYENREQGIYLYYSNNSRIYHNNYIGNSYPFDYYGNTNLWDNGYPSGGNYWSEGHFTGTDSNGDGIADSPYAIFGGSSVDRYPLMRPYTGPIFSTPTITVTSPNGGENWQAGTTQTIKWSYTGNPGDNVKIELLKGGVVDRTITSSTPTSSGSYDWIIPSIAGSDYQIKITSTTNGAYSDMSDGYFTITSTTPTENIPPDKPTNLMQVKPFSSEFNIGQSIEEKTVWFYAEINDPDGDKVKLQVEYYGFNNFDGNIYQKKLESIFKESGSESGLLISSDSYVGDLSDAGYRWKARAVDEHDAASDWVEFGDNGDNYDFIITTDIKKTIRNRINQLVQQILVEVEQPCIIFYGSQGLFGFTEEECNHYKELYFDVTTAQSDSTSDYRYALKSANIGDFDKANTYISAGQLQFDNSVVYYSNSAEYYDKTIANKIANVKLVKDVSFFTVKMGASAISPGAGYFADMLFIGVDLAVDEKMYGADYARKKAATSFLVSTMFQFMPNALLGDETMEDYFGNMAGQEIYVKANMLLNPKDGFNPQSAEYLIDAMSRAGFTEVTGEILDETVHQFWETFSATLLSIKAKSPGELRVYDSQGNITGIVNGMVIEDIPNSIYDKENETVTILLANDKYKYEFKGNSTGTYGLDIFYSKENKSYPISINNIPISTNESHNYTIDWDKFANGEVATTVEIDLTGDGIIDEIKYVILPTALFEVSPLISVVDKDITFNATRSNGSIVSYEWEFGDGNVGNGKIVKHSYSTIGIYTVNLTVKDENNAMDKMSQKLYVSPYKFNGFFQPIDNLPTLNTVKAGSAVPIKFNLSGYQGLNIFTTGYPKSQKIDCDSNAPISTVEETTTAGSSSLSYNATIDQYNYVWKTDKTWGNTCRQFLMILKDGTYHNASFKFLK